MTNNNTHSRRVTATFLVAAATLAASLVLVVSAWSGNSSASTGHDHGATVVTSKSSSAVKQRNLYVGMRTLWSQHMAWTFAVVSSFATGSPALNADIDRLLKNQQDIGKGIRPYYGKKAADQLTELLTEHIKLAVPVLTAAKAGDKAALDSAAANWYANAKQIGSFLAKANRNWKGASGMMKEHIDGTIAYAADAIGGDYAKSIKDYDKAEKHMLMLSDVLAAGLIKQFPKKFR